MELFDRAVRVFTRSGPHSRPQLAETLDRQAAALRALGRTAEADASAARAAAVRKDIAAHPAPPL